MICMVNFAVLFLESLLSARTAMWSTAAVLTEWENEWESMRITTNTVIFRHLCHLTLGHWRGKILLFRCDSQWFVNQFEIVLRQFLVICKQLWKHFWGDSRWLSAMHKSVWNCFRVILGDTQTTVKTFYVWFLIILWFVNHSKIVLGWFSVIHETLWRFLGWFSDGSEIDSWWFLNHSENILWAIINDLWISLTLFWGDIQWFLVICKPLWKHFWDDSWWFLVFREPLWKHFWG